MNDTRAPDYNDKTDEATVCASLRAPREACADLEPNEARQGATHHNVRYVLGISLVAVIVAMAVAYFAFFPTNNPAPLGPVTEPPAATSPTTPPA